jgi:tyrosyl-tRNA synthetase
VHGLDAAASAIAASAALFGDGDLAALDEATLTAIIAELPSADVDTHTPVSQALVDTGLSASLSDARRAIGQGGVYLNNAKVETEDAEVGNVGLAGSIAILRRGKKTAAGLRLR